jgi:hypothetical protein
MSESESLPNSTSFSEKEVINLKSQIISLELNMKESLKKKDKEIENNEIVIKKLNELLKQKEERISHLEHNLNFDRKIKEIKELEAKLEKAENRINLLERESYFDTIKSMPKFSRFEKSRHSLRNVEQFDMIKKLAKDQLENLNQKNIPRSFSILEEVLQKKKDELRMKQEAREDIDDNMTLNVFEDRNEINEIENICEIKDVTKKRNASNTFDFFNKTIESLQEVISKSEQISKENENRLKDLNEQNEILIKNLDDMNIMLDDKDYQYQQLLVNCDESKIELETLKNNYDKLNEEKKVLQKSLKSYESEGGQINTNLNELQTLVHHLKSQNEVLKENYETSIQIYKKEKKVFDENIDEFNRKLSMKEEEIEKLEQQNKKENLKNNELIKMINENKQKNLEKEEEILKRIKEREVYFENQFEALNKKIKDLENEKDFNNKINHQVNPDINIEHQIDLDNLKLDENNLVVNNDVSGLDLSSNDSQEEADEFDERDLLQLSNKRKKSFEVRGSIFGNDHLNGLTLDDHIDINKKEQELEEAKKTILRYLDTLEENQEEIRRLKHECEISKENYIDIDSHQNEIELLKLDIKHLKENMESEQKLFENQKKKLEKELEDMTSELMQTKIDFSLSFPQMDHQLMTSNREIKKLKYQIDLYENQIRSFNERFDK